MTVLLQSRRPARLFGGCVVVCSVLAMAGCGHRGASYPATQLTGTVMVHAKPLAEGSLQFLPQAAGQGPAVGAAVKNGRYTVNGVTLGDVRVILVSIKQTHRLPPDGTGRERWATENLIPEPFRDGITIHVTANQSVQDFNL